jgi:hypothetical protein
MLYKILDKYSKLKNNHEIKQNEQNRIIEEYDKEIIENFLNLYDKDVKKIHTNEEKIEKNLQSLYNESIEIEKTCKEAFSMYDELLEFFKETGDLFNWCNILEKEMDVIKKQVLDRNKKNENEKKEENN